MKNNKEAAKLITIRIAYTNAYKMGCIISLKIMKIL